MYLIDDCFSTITGCYCFSDNVTKIQLNFEKTIKCTKKSIFPTRVLIVYSLSITYSHHISKAIT